MLQGEGSGNYCPDDRTENKNKHPMNHTVFFLQTPDVSVGQGLLLKEESITSHMLVTMFLTGSGWDTWHAISVYVWSGLRQGVW